MTPDELRALADAATPGPWEIDPESPYYDEFSDIDLGQWWFSRPNIAALHETDARLIALAPALARLCADMSQMLEVVQEENPRLMTRDIAEALAKITELEAA